MLEFRLLGLMGLMLGIKHITFFICGSAIVAVSASNVSAQRRPGIAPPNELLKVLDQEDRDCVTTNGGLSKAVKVQRIRLATDGTSQLLVRGSNSCLCGAQNCGFWIYRKKAGDHELLLKGDGATSVRAARVLSYGYRDVISESHASASETIVRTYRYEGASYQLQSCVNRAYYDDNGKYTKKPTNRPCAGDSSTSQ